MKVHIPTRREIERKLEISEIHRINKLWLYTLGRCVRISKERLRDLYANVCQMAGDIYEDPEPEDYNEREWVAKQKHKENHKKWRV